MINFFGILFILEVVMAAAILCIGCLSCHEDTKISSATDAEKTPLRRVA